jgi:hypothetical protein
VTPPKLSPKGTRHVGLCTNDPSPNSITVKAKNESLGFLITCADLIEFTFFRPVFAFRKRRTSRKALPDGAPG